MRNQVLEINSDSIDEIGIFGDRFEFFQANYAKSGGQIERIESLMVNWDLNRANQKPRTGIKKARKVKVALEILTGIQLHKIKSLESIEGAIRAVVNRGTKSHFYLPIIYKLAGVPALFSHLNSVRHAIAATGQCRGNNPSLHAMGSRRVAVLCYK